MVDRFGQVPEEALERGWIGGVEGRTTQRAEFGRGPLEAAGIAAGQDDARALGAGSPGRLEPDAGAAADHNDGLPGQPGFPLDGRDGGCGGHDSSSGSCRITWDTIRRSGEREAAPSAPVAADREARYAETAWTSRARWRCSPAGAGAGGRGGTASPHRAAGPRPPPRGLAPP